MLKKMFKLGVTLAVNPTCVANHQSLGWALTGEYEDDDAPAVPGPIYPTTPPALREDGPTVDQFVLAGYDPSTYPPAGYASLNTEAEIDAAKVAYAALIASKSAQGAAPVLTVDVVNAMTDKDGIAALLELRGATVDRRHGIETMRADLLALMGAT